MTPFTAFGLYVLCLWLVYALTARPLQPDQLEDDLADVDLTEHSRQRGMRESDWWDNPVINVRLSRRG